MRKFIYVLIVLIIAVIIGYNYVYKEHRNIETENAEFSIKSIEIINEFALNIDFSTQKYLNKTIEVSGTITEIGKGTLTMNTTIFCYMNDSIINDLFLNKQVTIKGRFIGYDELLEELKIDQASIITNN